MRKKTLANQQVSKGGAPEANLLKSLHISVLDCRDESA